MPFDVIGFSEATPAAGTVNIAGALEDTLYRVTGDDILVRVDAPYVLGVTYEALTVPASMILRQPQMVDYHLVKSKLGTALNGMLGYTHMFGRPLPLRGGDKLNALSVNAADEITQIGVLLGSGKITQAMLDSVNPTHVIRGSGAKTLVAHTWTQATITWAESLPAGKYAVVGMRGGVYKAATPQNALARLVIPGATNWRPGVPFSDALSAGTMGTLTQDPCANWPKMSEVVLDPNLGMPNLELLCTVACTAEFVELTLEKIA